MGESESTPICFSFNGSIHTEGRPEMMTTNAGALLLREVDERLGLTAWLREQLFDPRNPLLITHPLLRLLRTRLYLMAQGHKDQDDADFFRDDPAFCFAASSSRGLTPLVRTKDGLGGLASQPTQSRLVEHLSLAKNLKALNHALVEWARRDLLATRGHRLREITLDVDSVALEVYGHQAGSAYNGHYHARCYHPLGTMLAETNHWLSMELRPGNVHTAEGATAHILDVIDRVEGPIGQVAYVRGDAGFPEEGLLSALEQRKIAYAFRLKDNEVLKRMAEPYLKRPVGHPPAAARIWFAEERYQAESWSRPRRVVLVLKEVPGELFLDHFWLLTNWSADQSPADELLEFYRKRGTMEGHLGEFCSILDPALSCTNRQKTHVRGQEPKKRTAPRDVMAANAVSLLLYALSYNLANSLRRATSRALRLKHGGDWSLDRVRRVLLVRAARLTLSGRRAVFIMEAAATKLWRAVFRQLDRLAIAPNTS